jgi:hypothetical protein
LVGGQIVDRRQTQLLPENNPKWDGRERRKIPYAYHPVHPWRWRALTIWIVVFTGVMLYSFHSVDDTTAKIRDLQKTNCNTKVFLLTAAERNQVAADLKSNPPAERRANRRAAASYRVIANNFIAVGYCPDLRKFEK